MAKRAEDKAKKNALVIIVISYHRHSSSNNIIAARGVGHVQLMSLPRSDVCGVVCMWHDV